MTTETNTPHSKICPECGQLFETTHAGKVFCTDKCRDSYGNVALKRGKPVIPLLITWRRHRNSATGMRALRELCRIASMYIEEDRESGRECGLQLEALWSGFHLSKFDRPTKAKKQAAL